MPGNWKKIFGANQKTGCGRTGDGNIYDLKINVE
jgi:hypothetical protein